MSARTHSCALVEARARRLSAGAVRPFDTDAAVLEAMDVVVRLRLAMADERSADAYRRLSRLAARAARRLHQRFAASSADLALVALSRGHRLPRQEREIVLLLAAAALGVIDRIRDVEDLQKLAGRSTRDRLAVVDALAPGGRLARSGLVDVEADGAPVDRSVALSSRSLRSLGPRHRNEGASASRPGGRARAPVVQKDQLVLSARVRAAFDMVVAESRHARVMTADWGLAEVIPYGRAVTALFSGPPGVGKTAAAEAMASELGRQIMVVSYAEVQSCWTGETEKHIARLFCEAAKARAVLFWDEADAMLYDRAGARQTWEIRDVNVLLQEIERFEGLCILATNRRISLDPALERRIAIKVEFERPDRASRVAIWRTLLPATLPLEDGIDAERLAAEDLTGGEIKNVLLNAARLALVRGPRGPLRASDFDEAVRMERDGRWTTHRGRPIGFGASRPHGVPTASHAARGGAAAPVTGDR